MNDEILPFGPDAPGSVAGEAGQKTSVLMRGQRTRRPGPGLPEVLPLPELPDELVSISKNYGAIELGHFDVLETIGRGGFGVVVKAFDRKLQRIVAIKVMSAGVAIASPARKRFVREARAGAAVRHENVVRIYAVEETPTPHLVMEYVPGESLQHHLDKSGPLDVREVLRIGAQIARGLAAAHATGLVHRDIKPANVMLDDGENRTVKLTDFGLARAADDASLSQSGTVVGTPMFMAPEQARGEAFDHRADLFSLGSVLYVMVCGRPPYRAANTLAVLKRVAEENPRPIPEIIPETPTWLCAIIAKLHARKPEDRYGSAAEVAGALEKCLTDLQQGSGVQPAIASETPRASWWSRLAAVGILASAAVVAGVFTFDRINSGSNAPAVAALPPSAVEAPLANDRYTNAIGMEFVRVPAGTSQLGGSGGVAGTRKVEISYDFYLGKYEVTRAEWESLMGPDSAKSDYSRTGSHKAAVAAFSDGDLRRFPVDNVTWYTCQAFIAKLNRQSKETGWVYRLPLATEWEYACRNGPGQSATDLASDFYAGEPSATLGADRANFAGSGLNRPSPVGSYATNRLGLYDMQGNVFEFLDDLGGTNSDGRLLAGGCWLDNPGLVQASVRSGCPPEFHPTGSGLRLIRVPVEHATTPRQQLDAVAAELKGLNAGFNGQLRPTIIDDRITELTITDPRPIKDIAPLRKLSHLRRLTINGGGFSDLSPIRGLPLIALDVCNNTAIRDLSPLRGMPLESLDIWGFAGTDLSPLHGMRLHTLNCGGGLQKLDLAPLAGMPLRTLCLNFTQTDDLAPLKGMPLEMLLMESTKVADLSALAGMKISTLAMRHSPVADPSLLRDLPLVAVTWEFRGDRDAETFRAIPTLALINGKPVEEFWKEFAAK